MPCEKCVWHGGFSQAYRRERETWFIHYYLELLPLNWCTCASTFLKFTGFCSLEMQSDHRSIFRAEEAHTISGTNFLSLLFFNGLLLIAEFFTVSGNEEDLPYVFLSILLSVSVSLSLIFANDCEEERRTEIQSSFLWFFQNPVWTREPPPPRSPGSSHLAIAGAPRIDHPASPVNQSDITLKNTIIAQTSNSLGHNIFFAFCSKASLLIVRKRAIALDL